MFQDSLIFLFSFSVKEWNFVNFIAYAPEVFMLGLRHDT